MARGAWALTCTLIAAIAVAVAVARPTPDRALRGNRVLLVVPQESPYSTIITDLRGQHRAHARRAASR